MMVSYHCNMVSPNLTDIVIALIVQLAFRKVALAVKYIFSRGEASRDDERDGSSD